MSTTAAAPAPTRSFWSRHRTATLLVVGVLVVVVLSAVVSIGRGGYGAALDPRNPKPAGAKAVAEVLDDRGVDVRVVRGQAAYLRTPVDRDTAVVVTDADQLGTSTLARLRSHAAAAGTVVLVGPSLDLLGRLGFADARSANARGRLDPGCDEALFRGVQVDVPPSPALPAPGCFGDADGVLFARAPVDRQVQVLSDGALLRNDRVLDGDNAAAALRLLGQQPRLVWYVADSADTTAGDAVSVVPLLPRWLVPGLWLLALVVVAFLLWRGRRLGPLVREPLPVVVRAAEATESRGRLYRRTHDRDHAAGVLRAATRRRLARALSLPPDVPLARLVVTTAAATGRTPDEVGRLLDDAPVAHDSALADLGRGLLQIETEVRRG